jgi:hypothetical protein
VPKTNDLLAAAEKKTGLSDWGEPHFREGLDALLDSVGELQGITPLGQMTFRSFIDQLLVNRLRFVRDSATRERLIPPIVITGLPRSGTTFLHRLMSLDPDHHAPPLWELLDPFGSSRTRRLKGRMQVFIKTRLLRDLDRKHFTRADAPEECTLLLANSFASPLFADMAPLEDYLRWYHRAPQKTVYAEYRTQLEILQRRHPGKRLVLKAPAHVGQLASLLDAVPEAMVVQTHRDPAECFYSHCSLRETLARFVAEDTRRSTIARVGERVFERDMRSNLEFFENGDNGVAHVAYSRLCATPVAVVREIYRFHDLEWKPEMAGQAASHAERNPKNRHGNHAYRESDWGALNERTKRAFGAYRDRFAAAMK